MFLSKIALAITSLSALAAASHPEVRTIHTPKRKTPANTPQALAYSGLDFYGPPQILALDDCTNFEAPPGGQ